MFGGCKHKWTITDQRFVPGIMEQGGHAKGFVDDRIIYGYTEISMVCDNCGKPKLDVITGRWSNDRT